jgi:hypothetical protein
MGKQFTDAVMIEHGQGCDPWHDEPELTRFHVDNSNLTSLYSTNHHGACHCLRQQHNGVHQRAV